MLPFISFKRKLKKGFSDILPEDSELENISLFLKNGNLFAQYIVNMQGQRIKSEYEEIKGTTAKQLIDLANQVGEMQKLDSISGYQLEANYLDNDKKASLFIYGMSEGEKVKIRIKV